MTKVHTLKAGAQSDIFPALLKEAEKLSESDAALAPLITSVIHPSKNLCEAMGRLLSEKLAAKHLPEGMLLQLFADFAGAVADLENIIERDMRAIAKHDPAARDWV